MFALLLAATAAIMVKSRKSHVGANNVDEEWEEPVKAKTEKETAWTG